MRLPARRPAAGEIEAVGAECWVGDPDRLGTLRGAMESVTIVLLAAGQRQRPAGATARTCTALACAPSWASWWTPPCAACSTRPPAPPCPPRSSSAGERIARRGRAANSIPLAVLRADPADVPQWLSAGARGPGRDALLASLRGPPRGARRDAGLAASDGFRGRPSPRCCLAHSVGRPVEVGSGTKLLPCAPRNVSRRS